MIIITGSVTGTSETIDELLAASLEHVRRSREEPGCISHAVHRDVENPLRLVFFERWESAEAPCPPPWSCSPRPRPALKPFSILMRRRRFRWVSSWYGPGPQGR
jgi:antibiotic biosynthesis monooxygenase